MVEHAQETTEVITGFAQSVEICKPVFPSELENRDKDKVGSIFHLKYCIKYYLTSPVTKPFSRIMKSFRTLLSPLFSVITLLNQRVVGKAWFLLF